MATNTPGTGDDRPESGLSKAQRRAQRAEQQKAELAARRRKDTVRRVALTSVAVIAVVAVVVVLVIVGKNQSNKSDDPTTMPKIGQSQYGLTVGSPSAPHKIIFYEDFICPYCGEVEHASETGLDAAAKAGKVYIEYRPFNLLSQDPYSAQALNAFFAVKDIAGDAVALKFHNLLYQNQPEEPGPADDTQGLIGLADKVVPAADQSKVTDAIKNDSYSSTVKAATAEAEGAAGVDSTPTIYFDGKQFQAGSTYTDMGNDLVKDVQ